MKAPASLWFLLGVALIAGFLFAGVASAEYQSLVETGFLDGVKADVQTAAAAVLAVVVSIIGVAMIIKTLRG